MKPPTSTAHRQVFYLGTDQGFLTDLMPLLEPKGLQLTAIGNADELALLCRRALPAVLILDLAELPGRRGLERFLAAVRRGTHAPEIICIAGDQHDDETMEHRLAAMRAGAGSYVLKPVSAAHMAGRVIRMCGIVEVRRVRILVVEDDPAQAKYISVLLTNAGMDAFVLEDPMLILDGMRRFRPHLILMDLYMPGATGAELAAIIRDQDDFFGVPILFLSAETDLDRQLAALKAGGDGFIAKPVHRNQLIGSVEHRIRMSRWLQDRRSLINRRETANGFLPRHSFMPHLDQVVRADACQVEGCGLMIIEIDASRKLLKALGLGGSERLLRQMETQISYHMTPEESATRLDDFCYALFARRESRMRLLELAKKLSVLLAELKPSGQGDAQTVPEVQVSVSIGIGLFMPPAGDAITLVSRGQKAAATARHVGGNQVRVWMSVVPRQGTPESDSLLKRLLNTALAQGGLNLLFQPIMPFVQDSGEVYEAQLRLRTLDGEQIPPLDFLPVAERSGLMPSVDRWVLEQALEVLDHERGDHPRLTLLVHQTIATLAASDWLAWFRDQLVQRNLIRLFPLIQFQMRDINQNVLQAKPVIESLKSFGVEVSVANVSGSSEEVALLGRLGVGFAKLSMNIVSTTEQGDLIDIIERLHEQGIAVIVTGIEDVATLARMWNCRPDYVQGNYLRMPSAELNADFQHVFDEI